MNKLYYSKNNYGYTTATLEINTDKKTAILTRGMGGAIPHKSDHKTSRRHIYEIFKQYQESGAYKTIEQ